MTSCCIVDYVNRSVGSMKPFLGHLTSPAQRCPTAAERLVLNQASRSWPENPFLSINHHVTCQHMKGIKLSKSIKCLASLTDSWGQVIGEVAAAVLMDEWALSHSGVPQKHHLEHTLRVMQCALEVFLESHIKQVNIWFVVKINELSIVCCVWTWQKLSSTVICIQDTAIQRVICSFDIVFYSKNTSTVVFSDWQVVWSSLSSAIESLFGLESVSELSESSGSSFGFSINCL